MEGVAAHAHTDVRPRGLTPLWACAAATFLVASLVVGVLVGPVDLGLGAILSSLGERLHVPGVTSSLTPTEDSILWELRVPRVVLGATHRAALEHVDLADLKRHALDLA